LKEVFLGCAFPRLAYMEVAKGGVAMDSGILADKRYPAQSVQLISLQTLSGNKVNSARGRGKVFAG